MTALKVGIASYQEMKARTMAVARSERRVAPSEPGPDPHLTVHHRTVASFHVFCLPPSA